VASQISHIVPLFDRIFQLVDETSPLSQHRQLNLKMGMWKDLAGEQAERSASGSTHVSLPHGSD
jgi:hypothetical protein